MSSRAYSGHKDAIRPHLQSLMV